MSLLTVPLTGFFENLGQLTERLLGFPTCWRLRPFPGKISVSETCQNQRKNSSSAVLYLIPCYEAGITSWYFSRTHNRSLFDPDHCEECGSVRVSGLQAPRSAKRREERSCKHRPHAT